MKETKPRGPKPSEPRRHPINVMMTMEQKEIARTLGNGSISAGVRIAIEQAKKQ